jgi:bifunctional NMN adenylyltransferase/nudix hydrolase
MKMELKQDTYDVGVIVGRFQVPELHDAHKLLIQTVCDRHDKVVVFLGLSQLMVTRENPLDFESRKQMILDEFPDVIVLYAKDNRSDEVWSGKLDEMISDVVTPAQSVVLYGGRDSFIDRYHGRYPTAELEQDVFISGKEIRKNIARKSTKGTPDWRAGVVWAAHSGYPTCYPTVDIAVFNEDESEILLARKPGEKGLRLIGGFADPRSPSYEADARREVQEEAGISITDPEYVGSFTIDDWRYRGEVDSIKTLLFKARLQFGTPTPDDDIDELHWVSVKTLRDTRDLGQINPTIVPEHIPLIERLIQD